MKLLAVLFACVYITAAQLHLFQELPHLSGVIPNFLDLTVSRPTVPILKDFIPTVNVAERKPVITVNSRVVPATSLPSAPIFDNYIKTQYYIRDLQGQASYGHIEPGQRHHAFHDLNGNKVGGFSYFDAAGKLVQTSYIADKDGYRVVSNNLPVAPLPIEDTPEVAAAKLKHLIELEKVTPYRVTI